MSWWAGTKAQTQNKYQSAVRELNTALIQQQQQAKTPQTSKGVTSKKTGAEPRMEQKTTAAIAFVLHREKSPEQDEFDKDKKLVSFQRYQQTGDNVGLNTSFIGLPIMGRRGRILQSTDALTSDKELDIRKTSTSAARKASTIRTSRTPMYSTIYEKNGRGRVVPLHNLHVSRLKR